MPARKPSARSSPSESVLNLRVILRWPPAGVHFAVQGKPGEWFDAVDSAGGDLTFEVSVRATASDTEIRFLGPLTQGPPASRFFYINVGRHAGQWDSPWDRRIKISLVAIPPELVRQALSKGGVLEAAFPGTDRKGGPSCATIHPLDPGWRILAK